MEISVCYVGGKLALQAALKDDAKLPIAIRKCDAICVSLFGDKLLIAFRNDNDMYKAIRYINHVYGKGVCKEYERRCLLRDGYILEGVPSEA